MSEVRDKLRASVFASKTPKSKVIDFFGTEIEVRQASLEGILNSEVPEDSLKGLVNTMIEFCFVPGTNEHVFEEADLDCIKALHFGPEFKVMQEAITEMMGINMVEARGESEKDL